MKQLVSSLILPFIFVSNIIVLLVVYWLRAEFDSLASCLIDEQVLVQLSEGGGNFKPLIDLIRIDNLVGWTH